MSEQHPNGKATMGLVVQVAGVVLTVVFAISTPLILMYSKLNALEVTLSERLSEVETQFKAADEFRNVQLAQQQRVNSLVWRKAYDEPFPTEVYFPTIAKHNQR